MSREGAERERDRGSKAGAELTAYEPNAGLKPTTHKP